MRVVLFLLMILFFAALAFTALSASDPEGATRFLQSAHDALKLNVGEPDLHAYRLIGYGLVIAVPLMLVALLSSGRKRIRQMQNENAALSSTLYGTRVEAGKRRHMDADARREIQQLDASVKENNFGNAITNLENDTADLEGRSARLGAAASERQGIIPRLEAIRVRQFVIAEKIKTFSDGDQNLQTTLAAAVEQCNAMDRTLDEIEGDDLFGELKRLEERTAEAETRVAAFPEIVEKLGALRAKLDALTAQKEALESKDGIRETLGAVLDNAEELEKDLTVMDEGDEDADEDDDDSKSLDDLCESAEETLAVIEKRIGNVHTATDRVTALQSRIAALNTKIAANGS